jgi:hypothetical protein
MASTLRLQLSPVKVCIALLLSGRQQCVDGLPELGQLLDSDRHATASRAGAGFVELLLKYVVGPHLPKEPALEMLLRDRRHRT